MTILKLCGMLANRLNGSLLFFAAVEAVLFIISLCALICLKRELGRLVRIEEKSRNQSPDSDRFEARQGARERSVWSEFADFRKKYQKWTVPYDLFSLFIQIFPLLAILGTASGLYIAISDEQQLFAGVEFALSSTVLAVVCVVIAKCFDALLTAILVDPMDDTMDRYEETYRILQTRDAGSEFSSRFGSRYEPSARSGRYGRL